MGIQQMLLRSGSPLSASALPSSVSGGPPVTFPGLSTSSPSTASGSGGTGSYTYNWQYVSGSTAITMSNPSSSATMTWEFLFNNPSSTATAVYRCQVSDGVSTVYTNNVTVSF